MSQLLRLSFGSILLIAFAFKVANSDESAVQYRFIEEVCDPSFAFVVSLRTPGVWTSATQARIAFNYESDGNYRYVKISQWGVAVVRVVEGVHRKIGRYFDFKPTGLSSPLKITIKRSRWRITVITNEQISAIAEDSVPGNLGKTPSQRIGVWQSADMSVDPGSMRYQPVSEIFFADDFTRAPGTTSEWSPVSGDWSNTGIEGAAPREDMSANPFSYAAHPSAGGAALSLTGRWFWDNYSIRAAAKATGPGAMGLCVYAQNDKNYLLFRWFDQWDRGHQRDARQLLLVRDGRESLLAQAPGGYQPNQWYGLCARVTGNLCEVLVDDQPVLTASIDCFGQGKAGLYAARCPMVQFDDVVITDYQSVAEDFSQSSPTGVWDTVTGKVSLKAGWFYLMDGRALTGDPRWERYTLCARLRLAQRGSGGIVFSCKDNNRDCCLLRFTRSKAQFSVIHDGAETALAAASFTLSDEPFSVLVEPGFASLVAGDHSVLTVADSHIGAGRAGLFADPSKMLACSFLRVEEISAQENRPKLAAKFINDPLMVGWANAIGEWIAETSDAGTVYWHRGEFFQGMQLKFALGTGSIRNGVFEVLLATDTRNPSGGYALSIQLAENRPTKISLTRAGVLCTSVAPTEVPPLSSGSNLRVKQRGGALIAAIDDGVIFSYTDPRPLRSDRLGIRSQGFGLDLTRVEADCDGLQDWTFSDAPVDWWVGRGDWKITARWPCQTDWSWFGGVDDVAPVLWSKRSYPSNIVVEFYAGVKMNLPKEPGYSNPSDLNVSICANGKDLSSGYSFIFAGWGNSRTAILRKNKIVAETDAFRLVRPHSQNFDYHRHWYHIRIEKTSNVARMLVDDQLALQYPDPEPLTAGQVAFWSYQNGVMLARVRVWYEGRSEYAEWPTPPAPVGAELDNARNGEAANATGNSVENGVGMIRPVADSGVALALDAAVRHDGRPSLRVTNVTTGGTCAVQLINQKFDVAQYPVVRFSYRISPEVRINLYARVNGRYDTIVLTGPEVFGNGLRVIGRIAGARADGVWRDAEVNLYDALKASYRGQEHLPGGTRFQVEELLIGNLAPVDYLLAGFGGNGWGASYYLDDVRLIGVKSSGSSN